MADKGPDGKLLKWCLSHVMSCSSDSVFPSPPEIGLPEGLQDVTLQTTAKSLTTFYSNFVQANMRSQNFGGQVGVVSALAYTTGLCITRQFVAELVKELLPKGLSPTGSLQQHGSECHLTERDGCSTSNHPLEGTSDYDITVETMKLEVNEDSVMENRIKIEADADNHERIHRVAPRRKHCYYISKNVPALYALCMKGVECKLCRKVFKGVTCIEGLVEHVKNSHKKQATARFLKKLRDDNTIEKIIGHGIKWCDCRTCLFLARAHGWLGTPPN